MQLQVLVARITAIVVTPIVGATVFVSAGCAPSACVGGVGICESAEPARAATVVSATAEPTQPRKYIGLDLSKSTQRASLRTQYLSRVMAITDAAIEERAYLTIVGFGGAASDSVPIFEGSMKARGLNSAYLEAAKRKLKEQVHRSVSAALSPGFKGQLVPGSDPAGAIRYGVAQVRAGLPKGVSAEVWIFSDGEATFGKTNLNRLLRDFSPKKIVATWLRPFVPNAAGVDLHLRGLGQGTLATANTRTSILIEEVWRRFCRAARARTCDVRAQV